jgi:iron complex transport system substrate-binding protein
VIIEDEPQTLVSGYYISTSAIIALDLDDRMVGIEAKADKRSIYKLAAPALIELPNVGTAKEFDLEGCAALNPDLVILPLKLKDAASSLEALGIDVLLVNPENKEQLEDMIALIASAANCGKRANELLSYTDQTLDDLAKRLDGAETPTVYLAGNSDFLSTAGSAMYQSSMISQAGGDNVARDINDTYWVNVSYEQILTWNPEYIILASDASYTVADVLADPNLASCQAIANGNVYQMPGDAEAWDSPVPSAVLGSVWLAGVLHPDKMPEADVMAAANNFYETFYGFTYREN